MNYLVRVTLGAAVLSLLLSAPPAGTTQRRVPDRPTLNTIVHGINSRGNEMFRDISGIRQEGQTYRITLEAQSPTIQGGIARLLFGGTQAANPPGTKTIAVSGPDDPKLKPFIAEIARQKHATVNIDMDLWGLPGGESKWTDQTNKAASIATEIAEARAEAMPDSMNTILAHSAGTVVLSEIIDSGNGSLFQTKIAASPMTGELSKDVLVVLAANDLPSTPTGNLTDVQLTGSASRSPEAWAQKGNTVLVLKGPGVDVDPSLLANGSVGQKVEEMDPFQMHETSRELEVRDATVEVLLPVSQQPQGEPPTPVHVREFEVSSASPAQVIRALEGHGGPISPPRNQTDYDRLKAEVEKLQPPKGGGIALEAVAQLPFDSTDVSEARWDAQTNRLVFAMRKGDAYWQSPIIDSEIATVAYRCVFGPTPVDPEISIGAPLGPGRETFAAGKRPVYYSGPIENTQFGLILLMGDRALAHIAYGGATSLARYGLDKVLGYHSLPEMYPAKYARQPKQVALVGSNERVVIESLPSVLGEGSNHELVYQRVQELRVRFGRTTAAERGYSDLFDLYYFEIIQKVPEFSDVIACARAIGLFKWIRDNHIRLEATLGEATTTSVFTPHQVHLRQPPTLDDLEFTRPLIAYGEDGPTDIFDGAGNHIRIQYHNGHLKKIVRGDGRTLRVFADDLGNPTAIEITGLGAGAFLHKSDGLTVFYNDVALNRVGDNVESFTLLASSREVPESDPWGLIETAAYNFIRE